MLFGILSSFNFRWVLRAIICFHVSCLPSLVIVSEFQSGNSNFGVGWEPNSLCLETWKELAYGSQSSYINTHSIHFLGGLTTVGSKGFALSKNNISALTLTSPRSKLGLLKSIALKSIAAMSCTEGSSSKIGTISSRICPSISDCQLPFFFCLLPVTMTVGDWHSREKSSSTDRGKGNLKDKWCSHAYKSLLRQVNKMFHQRGDPRWVMKLLSG